MTIGLRFDKGASEGTANQTREDFAIGDVATIRATGVVGTATFQVLKSAPGSASALVVVDPVTQTIAIDVAGRWRIRVGDTADGSRVTHTFAAPTIRKGLIAPAHNERASEDANEADTDPGTWPDESESNLGGRNTGYAPDLEKAIAVLEDEGAETGWLSGCDITINGGNPSQYDLAAGFIFVKGTGAVAVAAQTGIDPLNIATTVFTTNSIDATGALVKGDFALTAAETKSLVQLQPVLHEDLATITGVSNERTIADPVPALMDYARAGGLINVGNNYVPATGVTVNKEIGTTSDFMLEGKSSPLLAPNDQPNPQILGVVFPSVIRDGGSSHTFLTPSANVPVGFWDDDSGTLAATIKYVNYQMRFFNQRTGCFVGQQTYDTLEEAIANALIADPFLPAPVLTSPNNLRTVIVARGDITDWTDPLTFKFIQVPGNM